MSSRCVVGAWQVSSRCSVAEVHLSQQVGTRQVGIRGQLGWVPMGRVRAGMGLGSNGAGVRLVRVAELGTGSDSPQWEPNTTPITQWAELGLGQGWGWG